MKHSIKRILSFLMAAALLGSTMLAYADEVDSSSTNQNGNSRIITEISGLESGSVYRLKHKNTGKYLTLNPSTGNVTIENAKGDDDTTQQWQFEFLPKNIPLSSGKFRSNYYFGEKYLDVSGSYNANNAQNTYLQNGTNVAIYDNGTTEYQSSQWVLEGNKLLAKMSRYSGNTDTYGSSYWKYLAPNPNGNGNVAQYGLSSLASGGAEWVYEKAIQDNEYANPLATGVYRLSQTYGQISIDGDVHTGVDIIDNAGAGVIYGRNVLAVADGTLSYYYAYNSTLGVFGGYGAYAHLLLPTGERIFYAHLSDFALGYHPPALGSGLVSGNQVAIATGIPVTKGTVIGKVGSTGWSSGAHLHLELRNSSNIDIDPSKLIQNMTIEKD